MLFSSFTKIRDWFSNRRRRDRNRAQSVMTVMDERVASKSSSVRSSLRHELEAGRLNSNPTHDEGPSDESKVLPGAARGRMSALRYLVDLELSYLEAQELVLRPCHTPSSWTCLLLCR